MENRTLALPKHILCVDDDLDTVEVYKVFLSAYEIFPAYSMAEGLAQASARSFDLYLLDNRLPDGTGVELCSRIRPA